MSNINNSYDINQLNIEYIPENPKSIAFKLYGNAEKMITRKHPWVFNKSIAIQKEDGEVGDVAVVFSQKNNRFLACGFYDPFSPIRIKLVQFGKSAKLDDNWFLKAITAAYEIRKPLFKTNTNSYRLIYGENDNLPGLIVDVYAHVMVVKLYSAIWISKLQYILLHLINVSGCNTVVLRLSRNVAKIEGLPLTDGEVIYGKLSNPEVPFVEHGVNFKAHVIKGHKTGYFLDHRHNRKKVGELAKNKTVLDVFSYAGGFSVHALTNGAKEVTSIDISLHALKLAEENVQLNQHKGKHHIIAEDAFKAMEILQQENKQFDIVVVDPPSFAKSEKEVEQAIATYKKLVVLAQKLVKQHGLLVMASCTSRITADDFFNIIESNFDCSYEIVDKTYHDIDHPITFKEGAYLKCAYYKIS